MNGRAQQWSCSQFKARQRKSSKENEWYTRKEGQRKNRTGKAWAEKKREGKSGQGMGMKHHSRKVRSRKGKARWASSQ